jgi:hypothetical protein
MSKHVTTRWYISAWIVWAVSIVVFFASAQVHAGPGHVSAFGSSPVSVLAWLVAGVSALVMLVVWIGALIRLGQLGRWGWFVAILVLQLLALGIIGMIAYAVAGPEDTDTVIRPSVT